MVDDGYWLSDLSGGGIQKSELDWVKTMKITIPPVPHSSAPGEHPLGQGISPDSRSLSSALGMQANTEVRNQWFNNKTIQLDGWRFISCRFDNCKLILATPNFCLDSCFIDGGTVFTYSFELVEVVRFFNFRIPYMKNNHPEFCPTFNADGTISVGVR